MIKSVVNRFFSFALDRVCREKFVDLCREITKRDATIESRDEIIKGLKETATKLQMSLDSSDADKKTLRERIKQIEKQCDNCRHAKYESKQDTDYDIFHKD